MGKRKSKRKAQPKRKVKLPSSFSCPFCNHESSIEVKMDKEHNIGYISCRICGADYQTPINNLSAAVDVYSDWIDACEASNTVDLVSPTTPIMTTRTAPPGQPY